MTTHPELPAADRIAAELRERIFTGDLTPGTRLVERTLAAQLGTSHIPVREALTRLTEEGLVERLPQRGARVARLTERDLEEIASLRTVLEGLVGVRVQERWDAATERRLRAIVRQMVEAAERGATVRALELDRRFHEELWELADHRVLLGMNVQLRSRITAFQRAATLALDAEERVALARSHALIVDALAGGDPDAARRAMADHVTSAARRLTAATEA